LDANKQTNKQVCLLYFELTNENDRCDMN